jgi:hypothetical protein
MSPTCNGLIETGKEPLTIVPLASIQPAGSRAAELCEISLREKNLFELYEIAPEMEKAAIEAYRQMQAIELAGLQRVDLIEASGSRRSRSRDIRR